MPSWILQSVPSPLSLSAAASYQLTVAPYLTALQAYPEAIVEAMRAKAPLQALATLYATTNPLLTAAAFALALIPIFFVASEVNRNYSQVDRFWSILPMVFNAHYAVWKHLSPGGTDAFTRTDAVGVVIVVWGCRLTFNYWRRGGYQIGAEDYRWEIVQKLAGPVPFLIFNILFISSAQIVLLLAISFPTYVLLLSEKVTGPSLSSVDMGFAAWILFLVVMTAIADQQQWNFQNAKHAYQKSAKADPTYRADDLNLGFNTTGLWRYSRHPNFTTEQGIWLSLYAWSCAITETPYNWSGFGALGYLILFQASTRFSEGISSGKYPEYKNFQKSVSMFIPIPGYYWSEADHAPKVKSKKAQ